MVEPIRHLGRDAVGTSSAVNTDDEEVAFLLHQVGHLIAERGESALMSAETLAVERHSGKIVGGTNIDEVALAGIKVGLVEQATIPDVAFVVHQFGLLGIPTARHPQSLCGVETVLHAVALVARHCIAVNLRVAHSLGTERVEHIFPLAVQAGVVTIHGIANENAVLLCHRHKPGHRHDSKHGYCLYYFHVLCLRLKIS